MSLLKKHVSANPPELTPKLDQTWVMARDLKRQPNSRYVLVTGSTKPVYYAIDYAKFDGPVISFHRDTETDPVYVCRVNEGVWALIRRDETDLVSEKEIAEAGKRDRDALLDFYTLLDPEAVEKAKLAEMTQPAYIMMGSHGHEHAPPAEDNRPMPGTYL